MKKLFIKGFNKIIITFAGNMTEFFSTITLNNKTPYKFHYDIYYSGCSHAHDSGDVNKNDSASIGAGWCLIRKYIYIKKTYDHRKI